MSPGDRCLVIDSSGPDSGGGYEEMQAEANETNERYAMGGNILLLVGAGLVVLGIPVQIMSKRAQRRRQQAAQQRARQPWAS